MESDDLEFFFFPRFDILLCNLLQSQPTHIDTHTQSQRCCKIAVTSGILYGARFVAEVVKQLEFFLNVS